jgi:tetratricopeptide (TPR) repeat protein
MSHVLVREGDFDGAVSAAERAVVLAPYDTFMLSSLMMVLVQVGRPDQALKWPEQAAARDPALGWFYNHRKGWAYLVLGRFAEAVDALSQTEFNDAHLLWRFPTCASAAWPRRAQKWRNDQGQSCNHVERLAPGIFLPRSCNR